MKVEKINPEKYVLVAENKEEADIIGEWAFNTWIEIGVAHIAKESGHIELVVKK